MKARQHRKTVQRRMKADNSIRYPWQNYLRKTLTMIARAMGISSKEIARSLQNLSFQIPRNEYIDPRVITKDHP